MRRLILRSALLARGQTPARQLYAPNVAVAPPPFVGGGAGAGWPLPFETQQMQQQRLLEMLDTGWIERPEPTATPPGCGYAGQVYTVGAMARSEGGDRQVCGPHPVAWPNLNEHVPLARQPAPGG